MNDIRLSARLIRVADFVQKGVNVADIGSDHAYLPCYLCLRDKVTTVIAGELNEGPYQLAQNQVQRFGLEDRIDVRRGNGLQVLRAGEVDVVTIAGMGGGLIAKILDEGKEKLEGVSTLVLQPNVAAAAIRKWLRQHGWRLLKEVIFEEDGMTYEILVAVRGEDQDIYEEDEARKLLLGPYLMQERNEIFRKKWHRAIIFWKQTLLQLEHATANEQLEQKRKELTEKIQKVEEVLVW